MKFSAAVMNQTNFDDVIRTSPAWLMTVEVWSVSTVVFTRQDWRHTHLDVCLFWLQFSFCVMRVSQCFQFPKATTTRHVQVNHGAFTCMAVQTNVSCCPFVLRKYSAWHELVTSCCRCVVGAGTQWVVAKGPPINWPNICISHIEPCWLLSACRHTRCCSPMFICCATYTVWAAGVWHPCHQILKHYVNAETLFSLSRELLYRFLCSTVTKGE